MIRNLYKKIVWTFKIGSKAADVWSFLKIVFYSFRVPFANRYNLSQKAYSWNIRVNKKKATISCEGTYEELLLLKEIFIDKVYALPAFVSDSVRTIVDGGANVGFTSIFYALSYPNATVYAFEPDPNTFKLLKKNTENVSTKNIRVFQYAIAGSRKNISFFVHPTKNISSSIIQRDDSYSKIEVEAVRLDDIFDLIKMPYIDVFKLDVEGAEFEIFKNSQRLGDIGFITSEIHADIMNEEAGVIINALQPSHFAVLDPLSHTNRFLCQAIPRTKKINVTFIIPSILIGGIESHLSKQTHYFDQTIFNISVVSLFNYPGRETILSRLHPTVLVRPMDLKVFSVKSWKKVYQTVKQLEPHVLVSSMFSGNTMSRILGFLLMVPVIVREHNVYTDKSIFHRITDHFLATFSYCIVAVSRSVQNFAHKQAWIPLNRFKIINNGVDLTNASKYIDLDSNKKKELRQSLGINENAYVLLQVARLKEQKNQRFLLNEFSSIVKKYPDTYLCIVGEGKERSDLEQHIQRLGISQNVRLYGTRQDVDVFYACADVFVLTSTREGFPNVIIEALSFGLPVISTLVSGVDEIFEHKEIGYIINGKTGSLVETVEKVKNWSPEKKDQIRVQAQEVATVFSIERNVCAYEDLFIRALLSKKI